MKAFTKDILYVLTLISNFTACLGESSQQSNQFKGLCQQCNVWIVCINVKTYFRVVLKPKLFSVLYSWASFTFPTMSLLHVVKAPSFKSRRTGSRLQQNTGDWASAKVTPENTEMTYKLQKVYFASSPYHTFDPVSPNTDEFVWQASWNLSPKNWENW